MTYYEKTIQRVALLKATAKKTKGDMKKIWRKYQKQLELRLKEMSIEEANKQV